jgi:hypothetical protein
MTAIVMAAIVAHACIGSAQGKTNKLYKEERKGK